MCAPVILVVDDEGDLLHLLQAALEPAFPNHQVRVAQSHSQATSALDGLDAQGGELALAVIDQVLDGSSGLDLIRRVRDRHPGACVLMYTGRATPGAERAARELGATVLWKPLRLRQLLAEVQAVLA